MIQRTEFRALAIAALFGTLAPFVLATLFGLYVLHIWSPTVRYLWFSHGVALAKLPVDVASVVDVILGALLGVAAALGIARLSRGHYLSQWAVFVAFFVLSGSIPALIGGEHDLQLFFLTHPLIIVFLASSALGFWLGGRPRQTPNVA
jgi:hypothetical protein